MGVKALTLFQGADWLTYRWSLAQAYDTLDRMQDIGMQCQSDFDIDAAENAEMSACVVDLGDDLAAELAAVEADLMPLMHNNIAQRWGAFENRLYLKEIRELASAGLTYDASTRLVSLIGSIKDMLRQMDQ